jgi:hypothetical protein
LLIIYQAHFSKPQKGILGVIAGALTPAISTQNKKSKKTKTKNNTPFCTHTTPLALLLPLLQFLPFGCNYLYVRTSPYF